MQGFLAEEAMSAVTTEDSSGDLPELLFFPKLKQRRLESRLTVTALAEETGLARATIARLEKHYMGRVVGLLRIIDVLNQHRGVNGHSLLNPTSELTPKGKGNRRIADS